MIILCLILSLSSFAGFSDVDTAYQYEFREVKKKTQKKYRKRKRASSLSRLLKDLEKRDLLIADMLNNSEKRVIVKKSKERLKSLTRLEGVLLNSAIATNNSVVNLIIKLDENEYFSGHEVRCASSSSGKRVIGKCDLVVGAKEYNVNAEIWDVDGARGIRADKYYDGAEKEFLLSSFSSFFSAASDAAKDRILTPNGERTLTSPKNKALSGLFGISENIKDRIDRSRGRDIQVALVNAGKRVIIFFNEGVDL